MKALVFDAKSGLSEQEITEFDFKDEEEDFPAWLARLGYTDYGDTVGDSHGFSYKIYKTNARIFPFMLVLEEWFEWIPIVCKTQVDMICLRAFLAPIILAESGITLHTDRTIELLKAGKNSELIRQFTRFT